MSALGSHGKLRGVFHALLQAGYFQQTFQLLFAPVALRLDVRGQRPRQVGGVLVQALVEFLQITDFFLTKEKLSFTKVVAFEYPRKGTWAMGMVTGCGLKKLAEERGKEFLDFFNKSDAINKRIHQIELLPGMGKKHMMEILNCRKGKEFVSFEDMKKRIQNLPDPEKAIEKRIFQELTEMERHNLFTN